MTLILAIVWVPGWFHAYGILFLRRSQYVGCTQYMATRTAILDVEIGLNQCLEEIAKREAPFNHRDNETQCAMRRVARPHARGAATPVFSDTISGFSAGAKADG